MSLKCRFVIKQLVSSALFTFLFLSIVKVQGQQLPKDTIIGKIKSIKDSISYTNKNSLGLQNYALSNEYEYEFSYLKSDSLFRKNWLLSAATPFRRTTNLYDRNEDIIHREWYDYVLNYKFKEDLVYYNKGQIQFYEVKNVPLKYTRLHNTINEERDQTYLEPLSTDSLRVSSLESQQYFSYSKEYDRKAYFEYNKDGKIVFEMNEDAYFQIRKFYYDYDANGQLILIRHFKDGQWKWTENLEFPDQVAVQTFFYPQGRRFPFLVEQRVDYIKKRFTEIEQIEIPEINTSVTDKKKKVITYDSKNRIISNDYWKEIKIAVNKYEYRNLASDRIYYDNNKTKREIYIKGSKTLTETYEVNALNQPTRFTAFNHSYNKMLEDYTFIYNDTNRLQAVELLTYDFSDDSTYKTHISFNYSYDSNGNWTRQVKSINGKPIFIWDRVIEYY